MLLDSVAPAVAQVSISGDASQRSMLRFATVTFSEPVTVEENAIAVRRTRGDALWDVRVSSTNTGDSVAWSLTFDGWEAVGGSLPDGFYEITIAPGGVRDLAGNALGPFTSGRFHRLFGDSDGDRDVDSEDLRRMRTVLNRPANYAAEFDYNSDGVVDAADYEQFRLRSSPASAISNVLKPAGGFTGELAPLAPVGSGPGADSVAIAHWDTVPNQDITGTMNVAVVAFHISGINRVEFSADGGPWVRIYTPGLNPETGVVEYWATLDASQFSESRSTTIRARVIPNLGVPRVLQESTDAPMELYVKKSPAADPVRYVSPAGSDLADGLTSSTPMQTLQRAAADLAWSNGGRADGGVIYCLPGNYALGTPLSPAVPSYDRWLTITPAPGVTRDQVVLSRSNPPAGLNVARLRLHNLTIRPEDFDNYVILQTPGQRGHRLWLDEVTVIGPGDQIVGPSGAVNSVGWEHIYATGIDWGHYVRGLSATLVRDSYIHHATDDIYTFSDCVINSQAHGNQYPEGFHTDLFQSYPERDNIILYGVTTAEPLRLSGGLFQGARQPDGAYCEMRNVAVVNCDWDTSVIMSEEQPWAGNVIQLHGIVEHLLLVNSSFIGPTTYGWTASGANDLFASNSLVRNCYFQDAPPDDQPGFTMGAPDVLAPIAYGWVVAPAGNMITATLTEGSTPAGAAGGFYLSGTNATVSGWTINGLTLTLNLAGTIARGQSTSLTQSGSGIHDLAGNEMLSFANAPVRNTSTVAPALLRIRPLVIVLSPPIGMTLTLPGGIALSPVIDLIRRA